MLRFLGSCMILTGCFGIGWWYRAQFNGRLRTIRILREILELLSGEVRYGRSTLPECCSHVAGNFGEPFSDALEKVGQNMRDNIGLSFGETFQKEFEGALEGAYLRDEDREAFLLFTRQACHADGQMQVRAMEQSAELLRKTEEALEKENAEKCRMAVGLGAMSGILLILILW